MDSKSQTITPIAVAQTPYRDKFGIPRQPNLVSKAIGKIWLNAPYNQAEALAGLEAASHIWLIWGFHKAPPGQTRLSSRPPRLGGNEKLGVFATRSTHRPNGLGLSVVELIEVNLEPTPHLVVGGIDLLDGTPVYDIKPYLPYVDRVNSASHDWAEEAPQKLTVVATSQFVASFLALKSEVEMSLIEEVVSFDPRPAYHRDQPERVYHVRLCDLDVGFRVDDNSRQATLTNVIHSTEGDH